MRKVSLLITVLALTLALAAPVLAQGPIIHVVQRGGESVPHRAALRHDRPGTGSRQRHRQHRPRLRRAAAGAPRPCDRACDVQPASSGQTYTAVITPTEASRPITYTWSPQPEDGQGTESADYRWDTPGIYTITLSAENCGGPVSETHTVVCAHAV